MPEAMVYLVAILYFAGGLLFWPVFRLFSRQHSPRRDRLRRVFVITLAVLVALGLVFLAVALAGRFNHNWLWATAWFPFINLISILFSLQVCVTRHEGVI